MDLPLESAAEVQPDESVPSAAALTEPPREEDAAAAFDLAQQLSADEDTNESGADLAAELDRIVVPAGQADGASAAGTSAEVDQQHTAEILDQAISQLGDSMPGDTAGGSRSRVVLLIVLCVCLVGAAWYAYRTLQQQELVPAVVPAAAPPAQQSAVVPKDAVTAAVEDVAEALDPIGSETAEPVAEEAVPAEAAPTPGAEEAVSVEAAPTPGAEETVPAEAAPTPGAEEAPPAAAAVPEEPYYAIHAGSYRNRAVAEQEARRLTDMNFLAYIERTDLETRGVWYRVKVGHCADRVAAEQLQSQLTTADPRLPTRIVYQK